MIGERGVLVSGNWKMNENHFEALRLVQELAALLRHTTLPTGVELSLHPPFTSLRTVQTAVETDHVPVALGAQHCHFDDRGAFTGEISPEMLAKLNVTYVIAGHSERRRIFGESDEVVRKKVDAVLRHGMRAICCVGESADERAGGEAKSRVAAQIRSAFARRKPETFPSLVVAYEPIWAIGTGLTATPDDAEEMCALIRDELVAAGGPTAESIRVQYGGSVTPECSGDLLACPNVDGLLVGGASLDAAKFVAIAASAS
ncbi:MAG TPA: triose-phosphate isomerase [Acidimicrobiales bacterium]|jgi:triosephosphate isomerase|nr:triose-phosphate isomerase [Acidimicrobiales bacterium]